MVGFHHHIYNGALPPIVLLANPFTRQSNPTWPADAIHFSIDFFCLSLSLAVARMPAITRQQLRTA